MSRYLPHSVYHVITHIVSQHYIAALCHIIALTASYLGTFQPQIRNIILSASDMASALSSRSEEARKRGSVRLVIYWARSRWITDLKHAPTRRSFTPATGQSCRTEIRRLLRVVTASNCNGLRVVDIILQRLFSPSERLSCALTVFSCDTVPSCIASTVPGPAEACWSLLEPADLVTGDWWLDHQPSGFIS